MQVMTTHEIIRGGILTVVPIMTKVKIKVQLRKPMWNMLSGYN